MSRSRNRLPLHDIAQSDRAVDIAQHLPNKVGGEVGVEQSGQTPQRTIALEQISRRRRFPLGSGVELPELAQRQRQLVEIRTALDLVHGRIVIEIRAIMQKVSSIESANRWSVVATGRRGRTRGERLHDLVVRDQNGV